MTPQERATMQQALDALTKKLKPCPFCGGAGQIEASRDGMHHSVSCKNHRCIVTSNRLMQGGPENAAARWNKRAKP